LEERERERERESFRSLNAQGVRGGGTTARPFYRGAKGRAYPTDRKKKSEKQLSLFFFSIVLFNSFLNFEFLKNAKDEKSNMLWTRRKIKWWIFGERENKKMQMVEERRKNQI
jgi:hypothetical protein